MDKRNPEISKTAEIPDPFHVSTIPVRVSRNATEQHVSVLHDSSDENASFDKVVDQLTYQATDPWAVGSSSYTSSMYMPVGRSVSPVSFSSNVTDPPLTISSTEKETPNLLDIEQSNEQRDSTLIPELNSELFNNPQELPLTPIMTIPNEDFSHKVSNQGCATGPIVDQSEVLKDVHPTLQNSASTPGSHADVYSPYGPSSSIKSTGDVPNILFPSSSDTYINVKLVETEHPLQYVNGPSLPVSSVNDTTERATESALTKERTVIQPGLHDATQSGEGMPSIPDSFCNPTSVQQVHHEHNAALMYDIQVLRKLDEREVECAKNEKLPKLRYSKGASPSMYCHICGRNNRTIDTVTCGNNRLGLCRKVICAKCLVVHGKMNLEESDTVDASWTCMHCRGKCPPSSRCHQYQRNNRFRNRKKKNFSSPNYASSSGITKAAPHYDQ